MYFFCRRYMFRVFGHDFVSILDGGLPHWLQCGGSVQHHSGSHDVSTPCTSVHPRAEFISTFRPHLYKTYDQMITNISSGGATIVDSRRPARFQGHLPPRNDSLRSGHIKGSRNIHYRTLHDEGSKLMKSREELEAMFRAREIDLAQPMIATCGSGISACKLILAAYLCGATEVALYDGSWEEFSQRADDQYITCVQKQQ